MANTVTYRGVTYTQADMTVGTQYDVQSLDNRLLKWPCRTGWQPLPSGARMRDCARRFQWILT